MEKYLLFLIILSYSLLSCVTVDIKSLKGEVTSQSCIGEHCDEENKENHEKDKYKQPVSKDDRWQNYIKLINAAVSSYTDCSTSCYKTQRHSDFRFWIDHGGIQESDFLHGMRTKLGVHYQIIDHKLYREKRCAFTTRCRGNEHFILKIIDNLPDMEMIINCHDWPKVRMFHQPSAPVFSFSKTPREKDLLYPAWTFWQGGPSLSLYPAGLGRWDLMRDALEKSSTEWPWEKKLNKGFFRGSRTSAQRDPLILLSRKEPELVDAQYTKNQAYKSPKDTLNAEPAKEIGLEDHCNFKYLFNFRGVAASFRFKHLFLCKSLVFHVGDEWIEFFYKDMKPWVHYIPVSTSLDEVKDLLEFSKANDHIVKEIAERGYQFIRNHLRMEDVQDYWYKILKRYSKLMKWTPVKNETLIQVPKQG